MLIERIRLVPHPDKSWEKFESWMVKDHEALLEVLSHKSSRKIVEEAGGDIERVAQQLDLLRSEKRTLH